MSEIVRYYRVGRSRRRFCLRVWGCGWRWLLRDIWQWMTFRRPKWCGAFPFEASLRTWHGDQSQCYCPTGTTTILRLGFFRLGLCVWLSRDLTKRPCTCDKIMWLLFPESHELEIEDAGGLAALQAEFPGINPMHCQRPEVTNADS